jgi:serpin B
MLASGAKTLQVSGAFHKAFVAVDEEGAEAAAATGVVMTRAALPRMKPEFHADRPFVWLIRDKRSGLIYFIGRITDPR